MTLLHLLATPPVYTTSDTKPDYSLLFLGIFLGVLIGLGVAFLFSKTKKKKHELHPDDKKLLKNYHTLTIRQQIELEQHIESLKDSNKQK